MKKTLALLLALACLLSLCACGLPGGGSRAAGKAAKAAIFENVSVSGVLDAEGNAYVPVFNGEAYTFKGDVSALELSPDRTKAVMLEKDGKMTVYTDLPNDEHSKVTEEGSEIAGIWDEGFLYLDKENTAYRYLFAEGESLKLGSYTRSTETCWDENFNVLYADEGKIWRLTPSDAEPEMIATYDKEKTVRLLEISKDGETAVWCVNDGLSREVYVCENGEKSKVGTIELSSKYGSVYTYFNESQTCLLVFSQYCKTMYIKPQGGEAIKVKLSGEPASTLYTEKGRFVWDDGDSFKGGYILTEGSSSGSGYNLFYIDAEGEREKILSDVQSMDVSDGKLVYSDAEGTLYYAKLDKASIGEPTMIAGDVGYYYACAIADDYVYYLKNVDDSEGTLYAYKLGDKEPKKVTTSVYPSLYLSTDGKTVYFYKDREKIDKDKYYYTGTLYSYTYGSDEAQKIASEVVTGSFSSGLNKGGIKSDALVYAKFLSYEKDKDELYVNLVHYNGSESTVIARDVIY